MSKMPLTAVDNALTAAGFAVSRPGMSGDYHTSSGTRVSDGASAFTVDLGATRFIAVHYLSGMHNTYNTIEKFTAAMCK